MSHEAFRMGGTLIFYSTGGVTYQNFLFVIISSGILFWHGGLTYMSVPPSGITKYNMSVNEVESSDLNGSIRSCLKPTGK